MKEPKRSFAINAALLKRAKQRALDMDAHVCDVIEAALTEYLRKPRNVPRREPAAPEPEAGA